MNLRYTPRALADLETIADHLMSLSPQGSLNVRASIIEALQNIVLFPHLGRLQNVEAVRKIRTRKHPYLIYYRVDAVADELVILTIQHGARDRALKDA